MPRKPRNIEEILRCLKHRCMLYSDLVKCASDVLNVSPATADNYIYKLLDSGKLLAFQLWREVRVVCTQGVYSINDFLKSIEQNLERCINSKSFKLKDICQCLFQSAKCNTVYFYQTYFMVLGVLTQLMKSGTIGGFKVYRTSKGLRISLL